MIRIKTKKVHKCANCGGEKIEAKYHMDYGHGERGYSGLRVTCLDCNLSVGDGYGYGEPTIDKTELFDNWNKVMESISTKKEYSEVEVCIIEQDEELNELEERYKEMSLTDFFNHLGKK